MAQSTSPTRRGISEVNLPEEGTGFRSIGRVSQAFDEDDFYYLECDCKTYKYVVPGILNWCPHLEHVLRDGLDAPVPQAVHVPIFRDPGVMARVKIDQGTSPSLLHVRLHGRTKEYDLGFITPQDGRWELRSLVLDFLLNVQADPSGHEQWRDCDRPYHHESFWQPTAGVKHDPKKALADIFYGLTKHRCFACHEEIQTGT